MKFDIVLLPADDAQTRLEVLELGAPRVLEGEGVRQDANGITQFRFVVNEPDGVWLIRFDDGTQWRYRDGTVSFHTGESHPVDFLASLPTELRMFYPGSFVMWGEHRMHFRPVLIQQLGARSLLVTFEHGADPAVRHTMVIDRTSGIATKLIERDRGILITQTNPLGKDHLVLERPFTPLEDWIRPDY